MSAPQLNATDYATLARAQRDVAEIGRMRTSSEHLGDAHRQRGHMLASLRRLEDLGFVIRREHDWSTGTVTVAGRAYLATYQQPPKKGGGRTSDLGLAPDGGTRFKSMLVALDAGPILSLGAQNPKLGRIVAKGRHKGLPMRAVTLEEGKTCPTECALRSKCYGGNMGGAKRLAWTGEETGAAIAQEIRDTKPVLVRLHTLGDFVSIAYARALVAALKASGSAAFGFTHWSPETTIGYAIRRWAKESWDVFSIRTSYLHGSREPIPERAAVIVSHPDQAKEHNAVVCPEQMGQTKSCASCGYCWHSKRNVAFVLHEKLALLRRATEPNASPVVRPSAPAVPAREAA